MAAKFHGNGECKHAILKVIFHCYNLILKLQYFIRLHHNIMSETPLKL